MGNQRFLANELQNQYSNEPEYPPTTNINQNSFVKGVNKLAYH